MRIQLHRFGCLHDSGLPAEVNLINGMWCGVAFLGEHAGTRLYARIKAKEETFVDGCCLKTLPSILYKYKGWGTLIQKVWNRFGVFKREIRVNAFTPHDSVVKLSTWNIGYRASRISLYPHRISSYSCRRTVHPMVNCGVSRWKRIRVNAA